jgi:hypothetical protein
MQHIKQAAYWNSAKHVCMSTPYMWMWWVTCGVGARIYHAHILTYLVFLKKKCTVKINLQQKALMGRNETPGACVLTGWGNKPIVKRSPPNKFLICAEAWQTCQFHDSTRAPATESSSPPTGSAPTGRRTPRGGVGPAQKQFPLFYCFFFAFFCCFFFVFIFCYFSFCFCDNSKFIESEQILKTNKFQNWNKFSIETNFKWEQISNGNKFQIRTNFK